MASTVILVAFALLNLFVLKAASDLPPAQRFTCPSRSQPVCAGGENNYITTLRNECAYAAFAAKEELVDRILYRGPCKGHEFRWSGWERDQDDIPANYEAYKLKYPDSKF